MARDATNETDVERLLADYVAVCNRVMERHSGELWFRQGKRLREAVLGETSLRTLVYDENPEHVLGEFTLHFDPTTEELSLHPAGAREVAFTWRVPLRYLDDVVNERPGWYLEHPLMLDGMWVTERARDALRGSRAAILAGVGGIVVGLAAGWLLVRALESERA